MVILETIEINEKKLKGILKEQSKEYQRYTGVLKEDFDSKIEAIGEQYSSIIERLDFHEKILNSHTEILNFLKEEINIIN